PFTLPFSLGPQGAPGCDVLVSSNAVLGIAGTGSVTTPIAIPFVPSLVGLSFHNQGAVLDPGANALGLVLSNATTAIIGWQ
ncbi:MAG: hypothetical protein KDE27_19725, partial [Planctomycetes bacterium]|nr:hypothetical protein [Planctomycetota bacterium]